MPTLETDAPLVGMRHHPGAAEALSELAMGDPVQLLREPENAYDENAIKVLSNEILLGYIAREYAAEWAPLFDKFGAPDAKLTFSSSGYPRVEIVIQQPTEEDLDALQESDRGEV